MSAWAARHLLAWRIAVVITTLGYVALNSVDMPSSGFLLGAAMFSAFTVGTGVGWKDAKRS